MNNFLTHRSVQSLAKELASKIIRAEKPSGSLRVYAIPRGGVPAAYLVAAFLPQLVFVNSAAEADIFIDDIIDSGVTKASFCDEYPGRSFYALIDKTEPAVAARYGWVVFPWESADRSEDDTINGTIANRQKASTVATVPEMLVSAAQTYDERNRAYGDNYKHFGHVMHGMFPNGLTVAGPDAWNRLGVFVQLIGKMTRYSCSLVDGGHQDSAHDAIVYSAMLEELTEQKK
jgi:hypothetical protein